MIFGKKFNNNFFQKGTIEWIGLRKPENNCVQIVNNAELVIGHGLAGDKAAKRRGGKRQVTLIQHEHLSTIASFLNKDKILPESLRRNIAVSGINLSILKGYALKIGDAILTVTGNCPPCYKMEEILGYGGFNAMRNLGGITAIVDKGGLIQVGDKLEVLTE